MIRADRIIPAVLADVVRKAPLTPEKVTFVWESTVGPAIRRSTRVHLDDAGVLHVVAADAHWAREIRRAAAVILRRLEPMLGPGAVRQIEVTAPAGPGSGRRR